MNIGQDIKELREYLGLTQGQLAKISGLTPAAICQIENNNREPQLSSFVKICNALEVEPGYFFRDKSKSETPLEMTEFMSYKNISEHDKKEIEKFMQFLAFSKRGKL